MGLKEAALSYAAKGWPVFPCKPGGKEPLTEHGFKDATSDTQRIEEWWSRWPTANIGFAIGMATGARPHQSLLIIDVDPRNGGVPPESLPPTLTCLTGGGGYHYYFTYNHDDTGDAQFRKVLQEGVDIKASGGYVLLPPSATQSSYEWVAEEQAIAVCPDWLLKASQKPSVENLTPVTGGMGDDPTDTRPGSIFNRTARIEDILEPHGWVLVYRDGEESFWRRPGKDEGISATFNYNGNRLFHVFTSSTEFEADCSYSLFAVFATLNTEGDFSRAAILCDKNALIDTANLVKREEYHYEHAYPEGHFVRDYIEYASRQTDAPLEYHEASALALLSLVTTNCRARLAPYPTGLSTNLYMALVGTTSISRKSTAQKIAGDIARAVSPASLLASRATPEALIKSLSMKNGIATLWMPDEFGVSLAEIYNRDYLKSLEELLLTLYGGDDYSYERSNDTLVVRQPHLSVLAAATPESIGRAGASAAESGLLPRFAVVYPAVLPTPKPVTVSPTSLAVERANLISRLQQITQWANTHREVTFDVEALEALNAAEVRLVNSSGGQRLPTMLYKLAILGLAGDGGDMGQLQSVSLSWGEAAIAVVERWRQGMERLTPMLYKGGIDPAFEKQMEYALTVLHQHNGVAARTVIAKALSTTKTKLDVIESTLLDRGDISMDNQSGKIWRIR